MRSAALEQMARRVVRAKGPQRGNGVRLKAHSAPQSISVPGATLITEGALRDNYALCLVGSGAVVLVDTPDGSAIDRLLHRHDLTPTHILNTHQHFDHVGYNTAIKENYGCEIIGPSADWHRIPGIDRGVADGDQITLGDLTAQVMETPGHTSGHVCYYFQENNVLMSGDTLFSCGCGRLLEGTPEQMLNSLKKLDMAISDDAYVACAHEYTEKNLKLATQVDPHNETLQQRAEAVLQLRSESKPSVPTLFGTERNTNPFLRANAHEIRDSLGMHNNSELEVFAHLRSMRDVL